MSNAIPLVLAIDDQQPVLDSLALKARGMDLDFVGARGVFASFDVLQGRRPDMVIIGLGFGDGTDPFAAIRMFRERERLARIVVYTSKADVPTAVKCMLAGAQNVLRKTADEGAVDQEMYDLSQRRAPDDDPPSDSGDRWAEFLQNLAEDLKPVAQGLIDGLTRRQIASNAGCSERSVYRRMWELCEAMGIDDLEDLASELRKRRAKGK